MSIILLSFYILLVSASTHSSFCVSVIVICYLESFTRQDNYLFDIIMTELMIVYINVSICSSGVYLVKNTLDD